MTTVRPIGRDVEQAIMPPGGGGSPAEGMSVRSAPVPVVFLKRKASAKVQITSCIWLHKLTGCDFPLFSDEIMEAYHEHNLANVNPFIFFPVTLLYYALVVCRSGLSGLRFDGSVNHVVIIVALICLFLLTIFLGIFMSIQALQVTGRDRRLADLKARLVWLPVRLEETILFLATIVGSLFMIGRVLTGQCLPGATVWEQQTCNQFASLGGIPNELAYALYLCPLILQLLTKNLSIRTLVISHLASLAVVAFCVVYSNAWSDYFVLINWLLSSNLSFEIKRLQRLAFKEYINSKELQVLAVRRQQEVDILKQEQERSRQEQALREVTAAAAAAQQVLAEDAKRSAEALKAKCSLVRHIGHEIRTPLNVMGVGVDMLLKELTPLASMLPEGVIETIEGIQDASVASLEVINELLMFEKLAAGMTTLECVPTPVLPFLEQAMKQHLLPARSKEIAFELVPSPAVSLAVTIDVDPIKLSTVFRNLFSNALKFTKKHGRVTVRVEIKHREGVTSTSTSRRIKSSQQKDAHSAIKSASASATSTTATVATNKDNGTNKEGRTIEVDMVEVTVQDTGAGLSAANLGKLFGEGVQFNANGLQGGGGSGLGLFITKGIVELHKHGKIWAESEGEGFGCTFFVHLPLHECINSNSHNSTSASVMDTSQKLDGRHLTPHHQVSPPMSTSALCLSPPLATTNKHTPHANTNTATNNSQLQAVINNTAANSHTNAAVLEWKPTILVVDDAGTNRKMLIRSLASRGLFTCREAEDGVEALSIMSLSLNALQKNDSGGGRKLMNRFSRKQSPNSRTSSSRALAINNDDSKAVSKSGANSGEGVFDNSRNGIFDNSRNGSDVVVPSGSESNPPSGRLGQRPPLLANVVDAVLIDSNMPRMNGPDAIVEMRKMGFRGTIIGVSGGDDETMRQFMQAGADSVMQKPAKTDTLVTLLMDGLRKSVQAHGDDEGGEEEEGGVTRAITTRTPINTTTALINTSATTIINNLAASNNPTTIHITRLRKFLSDVDEAATAAAAAAAITAAAGGHK